MKNFVLTIVYLKLAYFESKRKTARMLNTADIDRNPKMYGNKYENIDSKIVHT